ncbi:MAG TPA: glycerate kinase, partial [Enterobacteriaceae bacterium]|nr:glycerate kinase [Enterobacteriaceae bacterium]
DVGVVYDHGLDAIFSVIPRICTLDEALENAADNLRMNARNIAAVMKLARAKP